MSDHLRQIRVVDVFTSKPLAGNQLAVVLDGRGISSGDMQRIAREMNLAETTFVLPPDNPAHAAKVRIFTPFMELPFAGHPTVGTAWVLANEGLVADAGAEFTLEEGVGPVVVRRDRGDDVVWMTHPPVAFGRVFPHASVAITIGIKESDIVGDIPAQLASTGNPFLFVALQNAAAVDRATPDPARVRKLLKSTKAHGVFLFAVVGPERLYSRMFAEDVPEDPATGSAAGPLGAFVVKYGIVQRAATVDIESEQGTKMGRQSFVRIRLKFGASTDIPERIEVGGSVKPVLSGTLAELV
jgi:trans-2,3-dihydro-3-hydroxyanthranilate isomerase